MVLGLIPKKKHTPKAKAVLHGVSASPGIAIGRAFHLPDDHIQVERRSISESQVAAEIERLRSAIERTREHLRQESTIATSKVGKEKARIFEFHQMILEDEYFIGDIIARIRDQHIDAAYAFDDHMTKYADQFKDKDKIFRERAADITDIKRRVLQNLKGEWRQPLNQAKDAVVVVTHDLTPSRALALDRHKIMGFATDLGGKTSHAAILARAYGVPAVVGLREITNAIQNDDRVIVDGNNGMVLVGPDKSTLAYYRAEQAKHNVTLQKLSSLRALPARTADGRDIELSANLEFADEVDAALLHGAQGIGLLRTEYLYLGRPDLPGEEEQFLEYSRIAEMVKPHPMIIRTLDLGGDKLPQCIDIGREANPMLGWRAIRICLERPEIFIEQIKAILRANIHGNVKILLPMISTIEEVEKALALIEKAKHKLGQQKTAFEPNTEVGVMIEIPSAALVADAIAERVDFLSIGTNDLVQYLLAVDRGNERIAHLFQSLHPAVLRVIKNVIDAGHSKGVWVGMCGEMAADRLATVLLVGMEIDELSVSPIDVPEIKKIIRGTRVGEARKLVQQALEFPTAQEITNFMRNYMRRKFKDVLL
ncbi:MAG: phosphoenolpyruvate--protein phosphotransferase [candidate division KSB1 bacterium]|nr:phosphoenolpyruvate--protein phosphotransferase [candidate division KSB1 bacterium]MDZ7303450.1 phosphoenolpyruvate--protein phosphotransferase [candidate division KSB1 bacterium]MDZ7312532.1 phosphoenolpyruvate--protein phosphotransferase [candidate division KSB1 bacterium]